MKSGNEQLDAEAIYLGLMDGFKSAGLAPMEAAQVLDWLMDQSPMPKQAFAGLFGATTIPGAVEGLKEKAKSFIPNAVSAANAVSPGLGDKVHAAAGSAVAGWQNPEAANTVLSLGQKYKDSGIGGMIRDGWKYMTSPDNVSKWAPYAASGLTSMVGAKMLGAGNGAALAAGVAGGYLGGQVMRNKPIVPQSIKDSASKLWPKAKGPAVAAQPAQSASAVAQAGTSAHAQDQSNKVVAAN